MATQQALAAIVKTLKTYPLKDGQIPTHLRAMLLTSTIEIYEEVEDAYQSYPLTLSSKHGDLNVLFDSNEFLLRVSTLSIFDTYQDLSEFHDKTSSLDALDLLESIECAFSSITSKNLGVPCAWQLDWQIEAEKLITGVAKQAT